MPGWTARADTVTMLAASRGPERPLHKREHCKAPVAQLDRVLPSEGRGRRFKSCRARQNISKTATYGSCRVAVLR